MRSMVAAALLAAVAGCSAAPVTTRREAPSGGSEGGWFMEAGDPGRASRVERWSPVRWTSTERMFQLNDVNDYSPEEYATPIVLGNTAYVGHAGRRFSAVRLSGGEPLWSFPMKGRVRGTAAYSDGLLFVADDEGDLVALSLEGREAWRFHVSYPILAGPLVAAGKVYIGVTDQNVFCLEASTGRPVWQYGRKFPRRNALWRTPGIAWGEGRVYVGFADGNVVALDADIGKVLWKAEVAKEDLFADVCAGPAYREGRVYAGSFKGPVVCLEAATGKELWRAGVEAASGFALGDELAYLGMGDGRVVALRKADGVKAWEAAPGGGVPSPPVLAGDDVLVGMSGGTLVDLDARTGKERGRYSTGSGVRAQPLAFEEGVLLLSNAGVLHWLRTVR